MNWTEAMATLSDAVAVSEMTPTIVEPFVGDETDTVGAVVSWNLVVPWAAVDWPELFPAASNAETV
jgi:hypothetical protein